MHFSEMIAQWIRGFSNGSYRRKSNHQQTFERTNESTDHKINSFTYACHAFKSSGTCTRAYGDFGNPKRSIELAVVVLVSIVDARLS